MSEIVTVRRNGVDLIVDVAHASHSRTVVFMPTTGETRRVWDPISAQIGRRGWRTIAADYRGHGDSARANRYDLESFCEDACAIAKELAGAPCVFVGGSIGGVIAMLLLGEARVDAGGLVLVDIVPAPAAEAGRREREKITAAVRRGDPAVTSLDPRVREGSLASEVLQQRGRLRRAAKAISVPTLLLYGDRSHVIGQRELDEFARDSANGAAMEIRGAGHLVARDQPQQVVSALSTFLEQHFPVESAS